MSKDAGRGSGPRRFVLSKKVGRWGGDSLQGATCGVSPPLGWGRCLNLETSTPIDLSRYGGPPSKAISPDGSERCRRVNQAPQQGGEGRLWIRWEISRDIHVDAGGWPGDGVLDLAGEGGVPLGGLGFWVGVCWGPRKRGGLLFSSRQVVADLYHADCFSG